MKSAFKLRARAVVPAIGHDPAQQELPSERTGRLHTWIWLSVVLFSLALIRRAWVCDDAFITMRVVDNLVNGRGFVFNVGERVLGLTNPLWALVLVLPYAIVREPLLVPMLMSVVVSMATVILLVGRVSRDRRSGAIILVAMCFSRAFIDFSTSGLEGALTHLLLVSFFLVFLRPSRTWVTTLTLLASLIAVNRFDTLVSVLVPWVYACFRMRLRSLPRAVALGMLPAFLWFGFAVVYYGFPLPNTAYAKLNSHIPRWELVRQGFVYLVDTVTNDTMTAMIVLAGIAILAGQARREWPARVILLSLLSELVYIVSIGGDYMSGRFLTPSLVIAAVALAHYGGGWFTESHHWRVAAAILALMVLNLPFSPFRDDPLHERQDIPANGIANERAWWQDRLSLIANLRPKAWESDPWYSEGKTVRRNNQRVAKSSNIGVYSWGAGTDVHIVDDLALTDPLLARIPSPYAADWRPGHLKRAVPEGYLETLESGVNRIADPCLAAYYEHLNRIVRGPLFSWERWRSIARLNWPGGITVRACPRGRE